MRPHVVVIGGGFAGAAAASLLAEKGVAVTLLEQRPTLGGRTASLKDGVTGEDVDNGQHLFLGAYRDTRAFLARLRVADRLEFSPALRIPFLSPGGRRTELNCPALPSSLGFLWGLRRFRELGWGERWALFRALAAFGLGRGRDLSALTVEGWLDRMRQPAGVRRAFWRPLCLATLNERPETACAEALAVVLREGFLRGRNGGGLGHSTMALGKLWSIELSAFLKREGGTVAYRQTASGLRVEGSRVRAAALATGEIVEADAFISAVPLPAFLKICPPVLWPQYGPLEKVSHSAIVCVNFWFSRDFIEAPFAAILDGTFHWVFNRHRLWNGRGASPGAVSLVLSGAADQRKKSTEELRSLALKDLRACFPDLREEPRHASVVWERQATPSPSPEAWRMRPPVATGLENFFLAGDWVDSGLPATIEAACRSGHRAALGVLESLKIEKEMEGTPC